MWVADLKEAEGGNVTYTEGLRLCARVQQPLIDCAHALQFVEEEGRISGYLFTNSPCMVQASKENSNAECGTVVNILDDTFG